MPFDRYYVQTVFIIARNALERQYRTSFLGIGWMLVVPVMQIATFAIIMPIIRGTPHERDYVLYLVSTFPLWSFIIGSLMKSTTTLIVEAETIKRSMVSTTVFPLSAVLQHFYTFLVSFVVMVAVWAVVSGRWHASMLLVPIYLVPVLIAVGAIAVAFAFLTPYVHDIPECVNVVASVLFWLTPVVYPITSVPARAQGWYALNPVYLLMRPISQLTYAGSLPSLADTGACLAVAAAAVAVAVAVHRRCGRNFVYYL
jgi:lipopolysaccharide transport system permease protein